MSKKNLSMFIFVIFLLKKKLKFYKKKKNGLYIKIRPKNVFHIF